MKLSTRLEGISSYDLTESELEDVFEQAEGMESRIKELEAIAKKGREFGEMVKRHADIRFENGLYEDACAFLKLLT